MAISYVKPASTIKLKLLLILVATAIIYISGIFALSAYFTAERAYDRIAETDAQRMTNLAIFAKKHAPVFIELPGADKIRAIAEDYSTPQSIWVLVSKTHSIPISYIPAPLVIPDVATRTDKSTDERSVRKTIAKSVIALFDAADSAGHQLLIGSGYRSSNLQAFYFNNLSATVGDEAANQSIARPGESEHQTGLAIDISTISRNCYLDTCFESTNDGQWLFKNAHKFGFILRYPKGEESVTGYRYEPWHFRYVGVDLATAIYQSGLTLDEAWPYLTKASEVLRKNGAIE